MRSASAAVLNILNSGVLVLRADLYTFTLRSGLVLRYTNADTDLTVGGNTYVKGSLIIKRSATKQKIGIAVDSLNLTIIDDGSTLVNGLPIIVQSVNGLFDGATLSLEKLFLSSWTDTSPGSVPWFTGRVSDVAAEFGSVRFSIRDMKELLNQQMPRMVNQPTCNNSLFDSNCGLLIGTYTTATTVNGIGFTPTNTKFKPASTAQADAYFALGKVTFTSGQNAGQTRSIKSYLGGVVEVFNPFPYTPINGDGISIVPGCDKLQTTCSSKYGNLGRFEGMPYIPDPSTAYGSNANPGTVGSPGGTGGGAWGTLNSAIRGAGTYVQ